MCDTNLAIKIIPAYWKPILSFGWAIWLIDYKTINIYK